MKKIIREVAQFQLLYDVEEDGFFIRNSITEQKSFRFGKEKVTTLLVLDRNDFATRCIQRAGNNLENKV